LESLRSVAGIHEGVVISCYLAGETEDENEKLSEYTVSRQITAVPLTKCECVFTTALTPGEMMIHGLCMKITGMPPHSNTLFVARHLQACSYGNKPSCSQFF
jgi:hypothetical protein